MKKIKFKAPTFWLGKPYDIRALLAWPLSILYELIFQYNYKRLLKRYPQDPLPRPVICVGNCVVGGAGKTPIVTYLAKMLKAHGYSIGLISRGYGGKIKDPTPVNILQHTSDDVGDEPLLLASLAPTWIGLDRLHSATRAIQAGAEVLIMDDGLQNPMIAKDLSFLVVDGQQGFGNSHLIPAGPLRETLKSALLRSDAVVIMGHDAHNVRDYIADLQLKIGKELPIFKGHLRPSPEALEKISHKPLFAFAGIGYPQKFFRILEESGGDVRKRQAFADHYPYSKATVHRLIEAADKHGLQLITTLKDWVRLPKDYQTMIPYFDVAFQPNDQAFFQRFILGRVEQMVVDRNKNITPM